MIDLPGMLSRVIDRLCRESAGAGLPIRRSERYLLALRNHHAGQTCFLLGNGPSVRMEDLNLLAGRVVFAVNRFHMVYPHIRMRPTYTVCVDPYVILRRGPEIATACETTLFVPHYYRHLLGTAKRRRNVVSFHKLSNHTPSFSINPLHGLADGASVIFNAMELSLWMGVRRIVLYGVDHDFIVPKEASFDGRITSRGESNHFLPAYREVGETWVPPDTVRIEAAFRLAREWTEQRGIQVVNASRRSELAEFPRVSLTDVLD